MSASKERSVTISHNTMKFKKSFKYKAVSYGEIMVFSPIHVHHGIPKFNPILMPFICILYLAIVT